MRYSHFRHTDPGQWRRKLSPDQAQHIVQMKDVRGLTFGAIAAWFSRNGISIDYRVAERAYHWAKRQSEAIENGR